MVEGGLSLRDYPALQLEFHHAQALPQFTGLHQAGSVDLHSLLQGDMVVPRDDKVNPFHLLRQFQAGAIAVVADGQVDQRDEEIAAAAQLRHRLPCRLQGIPEGKAGHIIGIGLVNRGRGGQPEDAHLDPVQLPDHMGRQDPLAPFPADICREHRKEGHSRQFNQPLPAVVKIVIAGDHGVVVQAVHDFYNALAPGKGGFQAAVESVAGIEQHHILFACSDLFYLGRDESIAAAGVIICFQSAVDIVGVKNGNGNPFIIHICSARGGLYPENPHEQRRQGQA